MHQNSTIILDLEWNELAINTFIGFVLLPVSFAFSILLLPLFLRLPAPGWPVRLTAFVFMLSIIIQLVPSIPPIWNFNPRVAFTFFNIGGVLKGGTILWFIWKLDILTRISEPWTVNRIGEPGPDRRPTRKGLPDYGEFGRFERLIYAAFIWLSLGAILEMLIGIIDLTKVTIPVGGDAIRHIYLMGFITHLIFGISVRMIPGFIHKHRIASARLVDATLVFGTTAAISRVLPLMLPVSLLTSFQKINTISQFLYAFSGIWAIIAVSCLAINLWKTAKL